MRRVAGISCGICRAIPKERNLYVLVFFEQTDDRVRSPVDGPVDVGSDSQMVNILRRVDIGEMGAGASGVVVKKSRFKS